MEDNQKKIIKIKFQTKSDFQKRIAKLWQDQKSYEMYEFEFPDKETEDYYYKLIKQFIN